MKDGATTPRNTSLPRRKNLKSLIAIGGGQAVENYDWLLYGLLSAYFGPQIFPSDSEVTSTLSALAVFGVAFVARPLGAVVLGPIADRLGRKPMMMYSVAGIAGASILIGFLPTSEVLGPFSGILLVVLRMIQGLSMGVEAPLFAAYALEVAPPGREAWYAGTLQAFSQFGLLLASTAAFVSSLVLGGEQMSEWGWRIPFIIGGLIGLFVIWMRRDLPESLHGDSTNEEPQQSSKDVLRTTGKSKLAICTIILVVGGAQVLNYGWVAGVPSAAASVLSEDATLIFGLTSAMTLGVLIMSPIAGQIADRFGVGRTFVWSRWLSIPFVFTLVILFMWPSGGRLAVVMAAGIVLLAFAMGIFNAVTSSLVPQHSRVTSVGIGHAVGVAVFGGTASYILVWLASKGIIWVFPVYVALLLAASAVLYRITYKRNGLHGVEYAKTESQSQQASPVDHQLSS